MNMHEHDDEFDLRISKRERLLPQFDAELDGPDADTDRVLLARARSASHPVQLRTPAAKTFRAPRWAVPVGLAATLVLSFTLLLHTSPPQVTAPASAPMASQAVSESMVSGSAMSGSAMSDVPLSESAVGGADADASAPAPMRERRAGQAEPTQAAADFAADALPTEVQVEPTLAAKAMPAAAAPAPAPPPPPPAVAAAASANSAMSARVPAEAAASAESLADAPKERAEGKTLDPDAWLRRIEQLRSRGLDAEARRELLSFRQQFPDRPLPAALQSLLAAP